MSKEIKGFARKSKEFQQNQRILKEIKDSQKKINGFPKNSKDIQGSQRISK